MMLTKAREGAQSLDTTTVMKAWENMEAIETPWGSGTMGAAKTYGLNYMIVSSFSLTRLQNGKVEFLEMINEV